MSAATNTQSAILLMSCPDQVGIVARVTDFLHRHQGNIIELEQHVDRAESMFFMRVEWELSGFELAREEISAAFGTTVAQQFGMEWRLYFSDTVPRMAVFVSKAPHCLYDILARYQSGIWNVEIPVIVSNHPHLASAAQSAGIDFQRFEMTKANKSDQEDAQLELLNKYQIDFIVLARYMQILSPKFIAAYPHRMINIHHSFLPAFPGAKPYHSAHDRGVKIIGATSHYVTEELDAGPIIEQDVVRVRHTESVADLVRKGQDIEKVVLSRAIWHHLRRQILVYRNRTLIFG